jgi:hypothetical protein
MKPAQKAKRKKQPVEPLTPRLFPLTASDVQLLSSLAQDMTDRLGRGISGAAVIRALVRLAGKGTVTGETIAEQVETELAAGRVWGTKPH